MKYTSNFGLYLPDNDNYFSIEHFNENFVEIDRRLTGGGGLQGLSDLEATSANRSITSVTEVEDNG